MLSEGWVNANIINIANIVYGKGIQKNKLSDNKKYPVFGANSIIGYYDSYMYDKPQILQVIGEV